MNTGAILFIVCFVVQFGTLLILRKFFKIECPVWLTATIAFTYGLVSMGFMVFG